MTSSNVSLVSKGEKLNEVICITHYSKLNKLLRVTSYVMRFINNLKRKAKCEDLILNNYVLREGMKQSLFMWLKENQSSFLRERNFDNIKHNLMIEKYENGLYRSMRRLKVD